MGNPEIPYWAQFDLRFHEDGDDDADGGDDSSDDNAEDDAEDDSEDSDDKGQNIDGLKSALAKERADRKKHERELKRLRKLEEDRENANKSEIEKATEAANKATQRAAALAAKLKTNALDTAIIKAAKGDLAFADIDDALALVARGDIILEQDEDDPSKVEIDDASVKNALKALLRKKPHLKATAGEEDNDEGSSSSTGSKIGSRGTRDKGLTSEQRLKELYPQLNIPR